MLLLIGVSLPLFFLVGVAWPRGSDSPIAEQGGRSHSEQRRHRRRCCAPTRWARRSPTSTANCQRSGCWSRSMARRDHRCSTRHRVEEARMSARARFRGRALLSSRWSWPAAHMPFTIGACGACAATDHRHGAPHRDPDRAADQRPARRNCRATPALRSRKARSWRCSTSPDLDRQPRRSQCGGRQRRRRPREHLRGRARRGTDHRRQGDGDPRSQSSFSPAKSAIARRRSRRRALLRASGSIRTTPISRLSQRDPGDQESRLRRGCRRADQGRARHRRRPARSTRKRARRRPPRMCAKPR